MNQHKCFKKCWPFSVGAQRLAPAFFRDAATSIVIFALCLAITACEAEATPYPVDVLTEETEMPEVPAGTPIRYALAPNTSGSVADLELIMSLASVDQPAEMPAPDAIGSSYDLIAAYGNWSGAALSPITQHVSLVINPALPPLNDPALLNVIRRAINPAAAIANMPGVEVASLESAPSSSLKAELANAGWPDGFDVIIAHDTIPGVTQIIEQLQIIGIQGQLSPLNAGENTRFHLALVMWTTLEDRTEWAQRVGGDSNIIDLFAVPISYWAAPGLTITFTPAGWPLANRE